MAKQFMSNKLKSISEIISKENAFEQIRVKAKEFEIVDQFKEIFPELIKIATAKKFEKGKLFLRVENSVWRSELNFKQALMLEKINKYFNESIVKSIKFL